MGDVLTGRAIERFTLLKVLYKRIQYSTIHAFIANVYDHLKLKIPVDLTVSMMHCSEDEQQMTKFI